MNSPAAPSSRYNPFPLPAEPFCERGRRQEAEFTLKTVGAGPGDGHVALGRRDVLQRQRTPCDLLDQAQGLPNWYRTPPTHVHG